MTHIARFKSIDHTIKAYFPEVQSIYARIAVKL
jgi:hypothetical protein